MLRRTKWSAVVALAAFSLLLGACGTQSATTTTTTTAPPPIAVAATTSFAQAGCKDAGAITQAMNGRITTCLRAEALSEGPYHISLQQIIGAKGLTTGSTLAAGPAVKLRLSPSGGAPGTTVTAIGTLSEKLQPLPQYANFCWDGCVNGLQYSGVPLRWTGPTTFTAKLVVPAAPWVESDPARIALLRTGSFPIGVNCLVVVRGCGLGGAEGSAAFNMTGVKKPSWCNSAAQCASLAAGPGKVLPGQIIKVQGYAPLVSVIGSDEPFAFQMQVSPGVPRGDSVKLTTMAKGGTEAFFGQAPVRIAQAPTFASLGKPSPGAATLAGPGSITADPTDPGRVFWCAGAYLGETGPSGTRQIPSQAAAKLLASLGYGFMGASSPSCAAVAPLPLPPGTLPAVAAAFTVSQGGSAPPVYEVALYTLDGGASWTPVPPPQGASAFTFGGFRFAGNKLQALYGTDGGSTATPYQVATADMQSAEAGWQSGSLACPASGPCTTLGPYVPGNCAMNGTSQSVLYSTSPGAGWQSPEWPQQLSACASAEVASVGGGRLLAIASQSRYPVRLSTNGGRTWSYVALPALPPGAVGADAGTGFGVAGGQLLLLPTGGLLAYGVGQPQTGSYLLEPGKGTWCRVPANVALPTSPFGTAVGLAGGNLWWVAYGQQTTAPVPHQVPVSQIAC